MRTPWKWLADKLEARQLAYEAEQKRLAEERAAADKKDREEACAFYLKEWEEFWKVAKESGITPIHSSGGMEADNSKSYRYGFAPNGQLLKLQINRKGARFIEAMMKGKT